MLKCGVGSASPCVAPTPVSGDGITPPPQWQLSSSLHAAPSRAGTDSRYQASGTIPWRKAMQT